MRLSPAWFIAKSANDAGGSAIELAADQPGGAGQFVGDGLDAGLQLVAVRIASAAIVAQRFHPGDADGEFRQAFAPRAAETVSDDDRNGDARAASSAAR